ncbi:MAG: hypothetical protein U5S82_23680 [Gammaproteobacteria bacterium]|nr:hypothetical protein [Gammaproteobacteria bacterium]
MAGAEDTAGAPDPLRAVVAAQAAAPFSEDLHHVTAALRGRFGANLAGVLFYGSCLRSGDPRDGLVDAYAVVDGYAAAYDKPWLRWVNAWLPPNVFYMECATPQGPIRVKYGVLSLADLERGVGRWFHSYLWGRFAQPVRLANARDGAAHARLENALTTAVRTFITHTAPCVESPFEAGTLWRVGLELSYAAELRPEDRGRAARLAELEAAACAARTAAAAAGPAPLLVAVGEGVYRQGPGTTLSRRGCRRRWWLRRWQGRLLSLARLIKAAFTFQGGVDYAAWKVERHTGMAVPVTAAMRRHPVVFGLRTVWRLLRARVLH